MLFAVPVLAIFVAVATQARGGATDLALSLLAPSTALTVIGLIGLLFVWRMAAMLDALLRVGRRGTWRRPVPLAAFLMLGMVTTGVHAYAGSLAWSFYRAGSQIFVGASGPDATDIPSLAPNGTGESTRGPISTPTTARSRVNVLLMGIDSSDTRDHALTDALLVVSVDPATNDVTMVSFPRDIAGFELWDGRIFKGKINSLMSQAETHPDEFPDGPLASVSRAVGHLLGVPIHYYASVDLAGFARMIDAVGGVTVDVGAAIDDPTYGGWKDGRVGFRLGKGRHTLDGPTALAFVRTRRGVGDNDFNRARRQQQLLVALQRKLVEPSVIPLLPGVLTELEGTIVTNFPPDRLGDMLDLGQAVDQAAIRQIVLGPPYSRRPTDGNNGGLYSLRLDTARLAALSVELFGADSRYLSH